MRIAAMPSFGTVAVVVYRKENLNFVGVFTLRNYSIIANAHIFFDNQYSVHKVHDSNYCELCRFDVTCAVLRGSAHRQEDIHRLWFFINFVD